MRSVYFTVILMLLYVKFVYSSSSSNRSDANVSLQNKALALEEKNFVLIHKSDKANLEVIMYEKNLPPHERKKLRRERTRKRKEKNGRNRKKIHKSFDYVDRNNEKIDLVRNRTVEMLRKGVRILDAHEKPTEKKSQQTSRVNGTLMEKILSHGLPRQNMLSSVGGTYSLPIGFEIPRVQRTNQSEDLNSAHAGINKTIIFRSERILKKPENISRDGNNQTVLVSDLNVNQTKDYKSVLNAVYDSENPNSYTETFLRQMKIFLKNLTDCPDQGCAEIQKTVGKEDPCLRWLRCKKKLDLVLLDDDSELPSCPCTYPSSIFYDNSIWDVRLKKHFKWRDASGEAERINIYKPGAAHCIRSLISPGAPNLSSQHCCYDRSLLLLTRGSGAGTVNFVSPDASKALHFAVDILPWRLCKGDFTRYNSARVPNNGNNCPENPNDDLYELEVKLSKNY